MSRWKVTIDKIDHMSAAELNSIASVPALLFILVSLVDLIVCIANNYLYPSLRTVYYDLVSSIAYPLGMLFAVAAAACVVWRIARGEEQPSKARMIALSCFGALILLAGLSTMVNTDNPYRFSGYDPSMVGFWAYLLFVLMYFWVSSHAAQEGPRRLVCDVLCIASVPIGIYALWMAMAYGAPNFIIREQPEGIFYHMNHYGYYLATVIMLSAALTVMEQRRPKKLAYLGVFSFNTVVLLLNNTFGAYLAAIAGLIALLAACWLVRRSLMRVAVALFIWFFVLLGIVSIWNPSMLNSFTTLFFDISIISSRQDASETGSGRWLLWKNTLGYIAQKPLLGWGAEGFDDVLFEATGTARTHCEPLMYAGFFGIPAALCYLGGCASVLAINIKRRQTLDDTALACTIAAFTYFVSSLVGNMYFYTAPLFFILMGMSFARMEEPTT